MMEDKLTPQTKARLKQIAPLLEEYHRRLGVLRTRHPNYCMHPDNPDYEAVGMYDYFRFRNGILMGKHWNWLVDQVKNLET